MADMAPAGFFAAPPACAAPSASQTAAGVVRDCEAYVFGKEKSYLSELKAARAQGTWDAEYTRLRMVHGKSPSFYLYTAGLMLQQCPEAAVRICTSCLELGIEDMQLMRCVSYFLVKAGYWELAVEVFDRIRDLAPAEPQSFLDGALVRALLLRRGFDKALLRKALDLAATVVTHHWADRFREVEWPALVLLHYLVAQAERRGLHEAWPLEPELRSPQFKLGLMVWLGWDTDHTDIDLHVVEPNGNEVYYSNKRSAIGGHLSRDFTQGYGPEVYTLRDAPPGKYVVRAKYYASHQQSSLTGATSAVLWTLRGCDANSDGDVQFETVRLDTNNEKTDVMTVTVSEEAQKAQCTHSLTAFLTPSAGYICDVCDRAMPQAATLHGCRVCDYDQCQECFVKVRGETRKAVCSHPLTPFLTPSAGFTCDECGKPMPQGASLLGCRTCNYDRCADCFRGARRS